MKTKSQRHAVLLSAAMAISSVALARVALADVYWGGFNGPNWATGFYNIDGTPHNAPTAGDSVLFSLTNAANFNTTLGTTNYVVKEVVLDGPPDNANFAGSNASIGSSGGTLTCGFFYVFSPQTLTISAPILTTAPYYSFVAGDPASTIAITGSLSTANVQFSGTGYGLVTVSSANNLGTGAVSEASGTLQIGVGGTTGSLLTTTNMQLDGTLAIKRSNTVTQGVDIPAVLLGDGSLSQIGTGTLILNGPNSFQGPVIVSAGTLQFGNGGTTGAIYKYDDGHGGGAKIGVISIGSGASVVFDRSDTITQGTEFSGLPIIGAGSISQIGTGTLVFSASNAFTGNLLVSGGTVSLIGGTLTPANETIGSSGLGNFSQSGGMNTVATALLLGNGAAAGGTYALSSGQLTSPSETVGNAGPGNFSQSGGVNTVTTALVLGSSAAASGSYALSSGLLTCPSETIGNSGSGTFTQSGGTNAVTTALLLGKVAAASGSYALNGGSLVASKISKGPGTAAFDFNGGTLVASGTTSNLFSNLSPTVSAGGAAIDTQSFAVTVGPTTGLLHNPTLGATPDGGLTKLGTGNLSLSGTSTFTGDLNVLAGTVSLNGGTLSPRNAIVGGAGTGSISQTGGTNAVASSLTLGSQAGATGLYSLSGGLLSTSGTYVGVSGTGSFAQSGGTNVVSSSLTIGVSAGSTGSYVLSSTGSLSEPIAVVGASGSGTFTQNGGTHVVSSSLTLGASAGVTGSYVLSGGSLSGPNVVVGGSGTGTISLDGSVTANVTLGAGATGSGSISLNGHGTLTTASVVRGLGTAAFDFNGGTLTASATTSSLFSSVSPTVNVNGALINTQAFTVTVASGFARNPTLGATADGGLIKTGTGTLALSGTSTFTGALQVNAGTVALTGGTIAPGSTTVGNTGSATIRQTGGTQAVTGTLLLGNSASGAGTYSFSGGTLLASTISKGSGTAAFDFDGGTLVASKDPGVTLFSNFSPTVNSGGATIDTQGFSVGLSFAVLHNATLGPTPDGGLTKLGAGILKLYVNETYTGPTTVSAGTLQVGIGNSNGSIVGSILNNAALVFNRSGNFSQPGLITGTGSITKLLTGTMTFTAGQTAPFTASTLSITGAVDMTNNDMILTAMTEPAVRALIASTALRTSLATTSSYTALAAITNSDGQGGTLYPTFDGTASAPTDVLVKYTYVGDTDLSGSVDGNDLANLLAGMSGGLTGWANGDMNYDGVVNATDLSLLLSGLSGQGAPLGGGGSSGAVPEPGTATMGFGLAPLLLRRRR